jgi:glycosyltransferase involved in cell wall biosynthesis
LDGFRIIRVPTLRELYRKLVPVRRADVPLASEQGNAPFLTKLRADLLNIVHMLWINLLMARIAVKQSADVYHAHDLDTLLAGYLASRWTGQRLVYDFHELFTEQFRTGVKTGLWRLFYGLLERILVKRADLRVTVCGSLGEWMSQKYGVYGIITVRNAPPYQEPPRRPGGAREPVILYHGGYAPGRGLEQLIESARYLAAGRIVFRGFGPLDAYLRALAKKQRVEDRVSFAPPVPMPELVRAASEADIGVIPYIPYCLNNRYCLPNKLFEYMMAGLAVAGSDLPELRGIIVGHHLGGIFDPEDPRDIARALNELVQGADRLEGMKRNALQAARMVFNWEREEHTLLKAYEAMT